MRTDEQTDGYDEGKRHSSRQQEHAYKVLTKQERDGSVLEKHA